MAGSLPGSQIFVRWMDAEGAASQITRVQRSPGNLEWSPDGSEIYFSSLREEEADWMWRESEIYAVNVETGAFRQLTNRRGPDSDPLPAPDGRLIAYQGQDWSTDTYVENGLYVMDADGSNPPANRR